jgi:hypothetical protein
MTPSVPSEDDLDALAEAVFGGEAGARRLQPLLDRFAAEVGVLRDDDVVTELFRAYRTDWALVDAELDGPGDTWARRASHGLIEGVAPRPSFAAIAASLSGVFEVWPTRPPWLRDRLRGISVALADPVHVEPLGKGEPAAVWEARLSIDDGRAHLLRPPLPYPVEVLPVLQDLGAARWRTGVRPGALALRRAWLQQQLAPRADPRATFARVLGRA